ncbi:MAG TPA: hypothetical protein VGO43_06835 [Pyrinomonadaceae bacterium]|nr:hypothetical protein [Pyrinomonadaceae bacterium]
MTALAQARRTVTNADLDRYRQSRVLAERELREDYARLGFPSPEEMQRRELESQAQTANLVERLKNERIERERLELERSRMLQFIPQYPQGYNDSLQLGELFWPDVYVQNGRGFGRGNRQFRAPQQQGYFAGGQFWPTGPRTPLQPLVKVVPRLGRRH